MRKKAKKTRGGFRKNAGRKPIPPEKRIKQISAVIPATLYNRTVEEAKKEKKPISSFIRYVLEFFFSKQNEKENDLSDFDKN
jgi:hypothetical protein